MSPGFFHLFSLKISALLTFVSTVVFSIFILHFWTENYELIHGYHFELHLL